MTRTRIVAEALSDVGLLSVAISYWLPSVRSFLGGASPYVFSLALAAFLVQLFETLRREFPSSEFSSGENMGVAIVGVALVALLSAPLLYWGFAAALLHRYAGT